MSKLIYCATPSRLASKTEEIMNHVTKMGYGPFHPLYVYQVERFENGPIGREKTMEFCRRAIEICDEFWLYGISEGTLEELNHAKNIRKPIKLFPEFDSEWHSYYRELGAKHSNPLGNISV